MLNGLIEKLEQAGSIWLFAPGEDIALIEADCERLTNEEVDMLISILKKANG